MASTLTDTCNTIVDNPEGLRTCRNITPWAINAKGSVAYTTPKLFGQSALEGFVVSTVINARPLNAKAANYCWQTPSFSLRLVGRRRARRWLAASRRERSPRTS
jgi:hypothetical protein